MGQLQKVHEELTGLGYQVIAVSPDPPEKVRSVLAKSAYDYRLLSDPRLTAARALGVAYRLDAKTVERYKGSGIELEDISGEHMLPVPTVLVLDTAGTIRFVYSNPDYKVRIDPKKLVAAARKALG